LRNRGAARVFAGFLLLLCFCGRAAAARDLAVTSPWLSLMVRFVGGIQVHVHPLSGWDSAGRTVRYSKPKAGVPVIAMDPSEARAFGIGNRQVRFLFGEAGPAAPVKSSSFLDPSSLAFIGQRLLGALSSIDPKNYAYYQRRLAEFQSRTETTVSVGKRLLKGTQVLDLTGHSGEWIRAAVESPVRPPDRVLLLWEKGQSLETLSIALQEAARKGWVVVVDPWTPPTVRGKTRGSPRLAEIAAPTLEKEMLTILNDIYLTIWNASGKRISPGKP
jgi:hypothetical protein